MKLLKKSIPILMVLLASHGMELVAQQETEIDGANLQKLIEFSEATFTDEIMVVHKNQVVCHWKNSHCDTVYMNTASMVKSWTGLVIGILIDKGLIKSEDELVCQYIPQWEAGCRNQVTIRNLLTMTAGLNKRRGAQGILAVEDVNQFAIQLDLDTLPDIDFSYSNESVQLLGIIIEKVTGKSANEYFQEVLYDPLGMDSTRLTKDATGHDVAFGGASTTLDDAVKIGMLMLNDGQYEGRQIVSENWVKKSITPSEKAPYYGYLWWLDNVSENKNFAAQGDFGQMTIVFPDLDLVFMRQQSCNLEVSGNMLWMGPDFLKLIASVVKEK